SDHQHELDAARRSRGAGACAARAIRHPRWPDHLLFCVSPMTAPTRKPHFDLARIRDVASAGSRRFWSSIEELLDDDEFCKWVSAEFPDASSMFDDPGRRQFLKLMGASLLLAGLTGCGETKSDHALPYVNQPDDIVPGVPRYYATGIFFEGYVQ